ncbi:hypothetical protein CQW23_16557 [Capsicum baccatum]|uniref:Uncharacterized protein n=1 Tax=Capsicum baccatum TaxID=33114 RepID=A0A2G2WBF8_CAPBA|nr:hypothetical protein CQW23_16557 [Capsicum baccatum]
MSLWAEHTTTIEQFFERPEVLECVRRMRVFGEHNWLQYTADEVTKMRDHLLKYPVEIDQTGKVKLLHAYGRKVRSVAHLLAKYQDVKIYFVSLDVVKMKITVDVDGDLRGQIFSKMHSVYHDLLCLFLVVDLSTSEVSTFQDAKVFDLSYQAALLEVLEILKSACETHGLPLAQT